MEQQRGAGYADVQQVVFRHRKFQAWCLDLIWLSTQFSQMPCISLETFIGPVSIEENHGNIIHVGWSHIDQRTSESKLLKEAREQIEAYFAERLTEFDLPLSPQGSPFQKTIWAEMSNIPHGQTRTYGNLATRANTSPRAVGRACSANPIPIIIPCHRVIGANGSGGYSGRGGLTTKIRLLNFERGQTHFP
ncbi:MAG: Methylated-DNA--protein-cysteine methyltransferase, constitutive [Alphaproteobacteria bacterium MarineAlpha11_Bin1]|nr:MAG: Methylated-DNA--protein-cysteine methyltransferase, constitutive [Alphaproteobacteria bacterium MarineAlpha11_Bin1]|tara:strand:+ start:3058 stop:3630 length:573 start_codon:yes stop_codon:yes gene_type:complete